MRQLIWQGLQSAQWVWLLSATLLAAGLVTVLYASERRLVSRRLGATLLGLRLAVLAILFLVLLEPVLSWSTSTGQTGRVVVAIDASGSMETVDRQASPAEKLAWARAIGLLGNEDSADRIDQWITSYQDGHEPVWVTGQEVADLAQRTALAEGRRQMVDEALQKVGALSRKQLILRLLESAGSNGLLERLQRVVDVELIVFGGGALDVETSTLAASLQKPPEVVRPDVTDLNRAILEAEARGAGRLEGIVLLSDGRSTAAPAGNSAASAVAPAVPVYPVLVGSEGQPRDLSVVVLEAPATAFLKDRPILKGTLRTSGYQGSEVVVDLTRLDRPELPPITQTLHPTGPTTDFEMALEANEAGRASYEVTVRPQPDETRTDNNSRRFSMQVVDDQARVLLIDNEPRWEFRYLEAALHRDERVHRDVVVFRQPFLGLLPETFFPRSLTLPEVMPEPQDSPFVRYDLVVIGDVLPEQMSEEAWKWLDRYVRVEGGTVILTAGKQAFPLRHRSAVVSSLLPVTDLVEAQTDPARQTGGPGERGFQWSLSTEGEQLDVLKMSSDPVENLQVWKEMPGHLWGLVGNAKPGAMVWAAALPPGQKKGLETERANALMAHHYVGAGQVIWLGLDSTWRWRFGVGDVYHHRFWGQLARWAADFKSAAGNEVVRLGIDRSSLMPDEETTLRARFETGFLRLNPDLAVRGRILKRLESGEEEVAVIDLVPGADRTHIYEARVSRLAPGDYVIRLDAGEVKLGTEPVQIDVAVTAPPTPELTDLRSSPEELGQLAQQSRGQLLTARDVHRLPELFRKSSTPAVTHDQVPVWNHWSVLVLLFTLLMCEWVLRKLNGLP